MQFEPPMFVDVRGHVVSASRPVVDVVYHADRDLAGRPRAGQLWVLTAPLLGADAPVFVPGSGEAVRVPMFAYRTADATLATLFGLGVNIGLAAAVGLRHHTPNAVVGCQLVLGHACDDLRPAAEAFRTYIGVVLRTGG